MIPPKPIKSAEDFAAGARKPVASEPAILFTVAGQMFAIAADGVQEIRSTDSLAVGANEIDQAEIAKVRHTIVRGHHTYYVVNAGVHFSLRTTRPALVMILRQRRVAVLVDAIERMAEIPAVHPLPQAFTGPERVWYRGLAYIDDSILPVVDPAGFLTAEEIRRLDRAAAPLAPAAHAENESAVRS
jgi:chemotaxis signal transduction protein